jgi:hypothetical protein
MTPASRIRMHTWLAWAWLGLDGGDDGLGGLDAR